MATNAERVGKAMDLLRAGLAPFVEREVQAALGNGTLSIDSVRRYLDDPILGNRPVGDWDVQGLLRILGETWGDVFGRVLGRAERSLVFELRDWRNQWAHQTPFSTDDACRALDSAARLLSAISASQADEVDKMKWDLQLHQMNERLRGEKRKVGGNLIDVAAAGGLTSWRDVVSPHADVASGRYQQAEFAADLWQVHLGQGTDEYRSPAEFFRRTYLTESLKGLLVGGVKRISGTGGDPVVQLQTNFGGGKTHSMLALYHLFSGVAPGELPGLDTVLAEARVDTLPKARRVVLVGNKISPGNPSRKPDGTVVRTLWGELAWQLGGAAAYARVAEDDAKGTSPGDLLRELMVEYGPCLILVDEWVAYARQLHDAADLPGGSFETQFSFAQALTESAKLAGNCLLVVSLPASDTAGSPHTQVDDVEVGGIRGREALERLRNVVGRLESTWRPATAEEGFEIVRRRLFEPISGQDAFRRRDLVAAAFGELYRNNQAEFPSECRSSDYEKRIQAAYPIHPEVFDRLYEDWSTLVKFQRTRGVLRLMAAVIHSLWERGDRSPLIMPSTIPIDDDRVRNELTRYLSDNWAPIIEKDVDGAGSLPQKIDSEVQNLGRVHATRRVARTIYLGSAPTSGASHRGIEDARVKLGCVVPGESVPVFGDALRRLAASATYLYQDGSRVWYSTQPTVTKLADDRATDLLRKPDVVMAELEARVRNDLRNLGEFSRVHPFPRSGADVPDELETRLVVLPSNYPYSKETGNPAEVAANAILESRGNAPRLYRNTLVFVAADKTRLLDLDEAVRKYLAWSSIVQEKDALDLTQFQVRSAETQMRAAESSVTARLPEVYKWILVPEQANAAAPITWTALQTGGMDPIAVRAMRKLKVEEMVLGTLGSTILRKHLDGVPLWRGDHVPIRQLVDDFARYIYLPRLLRPGVLINAIQSGLGLLTWQSDTFAFAESRDGVDGRWAGLRGGQVVVLDADSRGLLVKPEPARIQMDREIPPPVVPPTPPKVPGGMGAGGTEPGSGGPPSGPAGPSGPPPPTHRRYYGTVRLDSTRAGRDAGRIADELISHLMAQSGAVVEVTLEIQARLPEGATDHTVRTVMENSRTLNFEHSAFERE